LDADADVPFAPADDDRFTRACSAVAFAIMNFLSALKKSTQFTSNVVSTRVSDRFEASSSIDDGDDGGGFFAPRVDAFFFAEPPSASSAARRTPAATNAAHACHSFGLCEAKETPGRVVESASSDASGDARSGLEALLAAKKG
jgi:hypothetical protein